MQGYSTSPRTSSALDRMDTTSRFRGAGASPSVGETHCSLSNSAQPLQIETCAPPGPAFHHTCQDASPHALAHTAGASTCACMTRCHTCLRRHSRSRMGSHTVDMAGRIAGVRCLAAYHGTDLLEMLVRVADLVVVELLVVLVAHTDLIYRVVADALDLSRCL